MRTTYKIIHAADFVKARPSGEIDLEQSKKVLAEIAAVATPPADYEILLDIRKAYGNLSYVDVWDLVSEVGRYRSAFRNKIAVLTRDDPQFDKASFMEYCAKNQGFMVSAFMDFEEATEWLQEVVEVDEDAADKP